MPPLASSAWVTPLLRAPHRVLFLDYDGTLVPLQPDPAAPVDAAAPDVALRRLLRALRALPNTEVHIVSGRDRHTLGRWLGGAHVALHAEHGVVSRTPQGRQWRTTVEVPSVPDAMRRALARAVRELPGTWIEWKPTGAVWHWRGVSGDAAPDDALRIAVGLVEALAGSAWRVVPGRRMIEIRPAAAGKGGTVARVLGATRTAGRSTAVLVAGDDTADLEMFQAAGRGAQRIAVGRRLPGATARVADVSAFRAGLAALIAKLGR
jgi:trehalose 6-phosphate synthase/phosphatase